MPYPPWIKTATHATGGYNIVTATGPEKSRTRSRLNVFLAIGAVCYLSALVLHELQNIITSHTSFTALTLALQVITDFLWSVPSAAAALLALALMCWFYYYGKRHNARWANSFPALLRLLVLSPVLLYTLFPLRWAQLGFSRSLESFPETTPLDSIGALLSLAGTCFCCLYFFSRLPLRAATFVEGITSSFFRLKQSTLIGLCLIICFLATGLTAYTVLGGIPHVEDSIAQLFQAKIFKQGMLYAPLPPHKEFFDYTNIINDERWYSQYPPGHSLLLTAGLLAGTPWLIGPLLGTLSLMLFYLVTKTMYGEHRIIMVSSCLLLLSPFFLFMSSSYMNHTSTLFFLLLFLYAYLKMFASDSRWYALLAGLSLGYAAAIRPLDAVAFAAPFAIYAGHCLCRKRGVSKQQMACFILGAAFVVLLLLLYNKLTTGNPFTFGYGKKYPRLGFLGSSQFGPPHTIKGAVINTSNNLIGLNQHLFEWPIPSLTFIFIFLSLPVRKNRWDYLMLCATLSIMGGYALYFYQDLCFGPRNYYSLTPFLILLTVRAFLALPGWLRERGFDAKRSEATLYILLFVCIVYLFAFSLPPLIKKYSNDYWWVTDKIHREVTSQGIRDAIVFIDVWYPPGITEPNHIPYGSGFQFNSPDLKDDVIYAMDLRGKNGELMSAFPGRSYYLCKIHKPMSDFTLIRIEKGSLPSESVP